jgi:hypothetical protein
MPKVPEAFHEPLRFCRKHFWGASFLTKCFDRFSRYHQSTIFKRADHDSYLPPNREKEIQAEVAEVGSSIEEKVLKESA